MLYLSQILTLQKQQHSKTEKFKTEIRSPIKLNIFVKYSKNRLEIFRFNFGMI